jgi:putative tricarboxylic transport membrane protein
MIGICAILFGAVYSLQAFQLPRATIGSPMAPVYFPLGLGVLMILLGLLLVIKEFVANNQAGAAKKKKEMDPGYVKLIAGTSIFCVIYAMVLEHIGFIPSTLFMLGGILFLVNGRQAWKINSVVTLVFTLGIWYVFNNVLAITLP